MQRNIPEVKVGIIAVSRDCFPIQLSERRRAAVAAACAARGLPVYEVPAAVENENDMLKAVAEAERAGCNALAVFLGNFGPETPETLIARHFSGPCMFLAAAEGDGDLVDGRGDAYCGMLNCSYNLGLRRLNGYIPQYPVGSAEELAEKIAEFLPIARAVLGLKGLKIITFGPRPQDFFACNAPIRGLYELGGSGGKQRTGPAGCLPPARGRCANSICVRRHGGRDGRGKLLPRFERADGAI